MPGCEPPEGYCFAIGDFVELRDFNPYKGTLKCGMQYEVLRVYYVNQAYCKVGLRCDNGTEGVFAAKYFELYTGIGRRMPWDASGEYEEAIAALEAMEDV